jgi:hypothetical protein
VLKNGDRIDIFDEKAWKQLDRDYKNWNRLDLSAGGSYRCRPNGDVIFVKFGEIDYISSSSDTATLPPQ